MEDLKALASSISQIAEEKGITYETVIEVIEQALAAAYKKDNDRKGENIQTKLNPETGKVKFWQVFEVVDEDMIYSEEELEEMKNKEEEAVKEEEGEILREEEEKKIRFNPKKHIMLKEALRFQAKQTKKKKEKIKPGDELSIFLEADTDYGRIAAQTAKQVILQRLKEAERNAILEEYKSKEGEVVSGIVQRIEGTNIFFDIGKALGVLTPAEQIPGEDYQIGQRHRLYLRSVEATTKGPTIILSRTYPKFVTKLFEIEVPEVSAGQVEIKSIAREPGFRTKIAVASTEEGIDPIGAMVGQRGTRVMAVINGLGGEKIDIIQWSGNPEEFIANALSPSKVSAARLTGWKIDVKAEGGKETVKAEKEDEQGEEKEAEKKPKETKKKAKTKKAKKEKKEK
jgi:N utilization substance protein A